MTSENRSHPGSGSFALLTVLIVVAVLYFARGVLIPVALAILFAFLLGPVVLWLRNRGLGPILSASIVVVFSLLIAAAIGTMMFTQLADLASRLPGYQQNMQKKIDSIRESGNGMVHKVSRVVYQINEQLKPPSPESVGAAQAEKPVPVEIRRPAFSPVETVQKVIGSLLGTILTGAIVLVFVLFMLIQRQDLRDRIVRLVGAGRINLTTQVLDDAAHRVSRYLLAQLLLNSSYGLLVGIGLYFIGIPNPVLWGILTMLLRYVPYLGIWIAALLPAAVAFAVDPGWSKLFMILGLYFGVDLVMYNFAEPMLYGSSTGLSPLAVLVTTVFWTWLWGPVGLLLATPLTVLVVVLGSHVPRLEFLSVLLSDQKPLSDTIRFYQRMLARDFEEASEIAEKAMSGRTLDFVYDTILIPALSFAQNERHHHRLDRDRYRYFIRNTRTLADGLAERCAELVAAGKAREEKQEPKCVNEASGEPVFRGSAICIAAKHEADEVAVAMLGHLLRKQGVHAEALPSAALAGEAVQTLRSQGARVVCVCSVPPSGYKQTQYLCQKVRASLPEAKIVAAVLTEADVGELREREPSLQADELATSLKQALAALSSLAITEQQAPVEQAAAA